VVYPPPPFIFLPSHQAVWSSDPPPSPQTLNPKPLGATTINSHPPLQQTWSVVPYPLLSFPLAPHKKCMVGAGGQSVKQMAGQESDILLLKHALRLGYQISHGDGERSFMQGSPPIVQGGI